jgi:hypothetical protein
MTREDPQLKVRLPSELKDTLMEKAAENGRSLNAEIVARMRSTLEDGFSEDSLLASIKELVVAKKITDLFGSEVADGIGLYAQHMGMADRWNEAVEELLRWSLIDFGIITPDEGETRPRSPFLSQSPQEAPSQEDQAVLDELVTGGPKP